jgi:DNA-binding LacI/PurR family transcriptional regulator
VFGSSPLTFDHMQRLASRGLRVVAFDRHTERADRVVADTVGIDNVQASRLAVEHLLALGHRRIGFISGPIRTVSRIHRMAGYQEALRHAGIEPDPALIWTGSLDDHLGDKEGAAWGRAGTRALLGTARPPTALVALNDMYAFGAYAAIRELGLSVPDAMSVVGFDDITPFSEIALPPLTTVHQPLQEMMTIVVERLIRRVEKTRTGPPEHTLVAPTLIVRASTAPPTLEAAHKP